MLRQIHQIFSAETKLDVGMSSFPSGAFLAILKLHLGSGDTSRGHPTFWGDFSVFSRLVNGGILPKSTSHGEKTHIFERYLPNKMGGVPCSHPVLQNKLLKAFWLFCFKTSPRPPPAPRNGMLLPMLEPGIPTSVWQLSISQSLDLPSDGRKGKGTFLMVTDILRHVQWKKPGCLGYIRDYTMQLCGDYNTLFNKPL